LLLAVEALVEALVAVEVGVEVVLEVTALQLLDSLLVVALQQKA
jgi:hypothetical protein